MYKTRAVPRYKDFKQMVWNEEKKSSKELHTYEANVLLVSVESREYINDEMPTVRLDSKPKKLIIFNKWFGRSDALSWKMP